MVYKYRYSEEYLYLQKKRRNTSTLMANIIACETKLKSKKKVILHWKVKGFKPLPLKANWIIYAFKGKTFLSFRIPRADQKRHFMYQKHLFIANMDNTSQSWVIIRLRKISLGYWELNAHLDMSHLLTCVFVQTLPPNLNLTRGVFF